MTAEIRDFLLESLTEMKYSTDEIGEDTVLGPAGADLESLALAELALRVEDRYGVRFEAEEAEAFAGLTVGEFCAVVAQRISTSAAT